MTPGGGETPAWEGIPKSFLPPLCGGREKPLTEKSAEGGQNL